MTANFPECIVSLQEHHQLTWFHDAFLAPFLCDHITNLLTSQVPRMRMRSGALRRRGWHVENFVEYITQKAHVEISASNENPGLHGEWWCHLTR